MEIHSIESIVECVVNQGQMAMKAQEKGVTRGYKMDGTIITEMDRKVEDALYAEISRKFPEANILTEETTRAFDREKEYIFAIDPIDGTDAYSQGMPGWCISVGLINSRLEAIAGIVYAPRWGSLFYADVGREATHNHLSLSPSPAPARLTKRAQISIDSKLHRKFDLRRFPGKIRCAGSTALHLCFPLIYCAVMGCFANRAHIWDFAAAHAILKSCGLSIEYLKGGELRYDAMLDGSRANDYLLAGRTDAIKLLREVFLQ